MSDPSDTHDPMISDLLDRAVPDDAVAPTSADLRRRARRRQTSRGLMASAVVVLAAFSVFAFSDWGTVPTTSTDRTATVADQPSETTQLPPPPELGEVAGIVVATELVEPLSALLAQAEEDGIPLSGTGYRSIEDQIDQRRENCGPTEEDVWEKPPWKCDPPTSPPGVSQHEVGLAVDFTCYGDLIIDRGSPCYVWLDTNAADYGLFNLLPSQPFHWSTNGR